MSVWILSRRTTFIFIVLKNNLPEIYRQNWCKFCAQYTCSINRSDVETFEQKWAKTSRFLILLPVVFCKNLQHCFPFRLRTYNFRIFNFIQNLQFRIFHFIHMSSVVKFTIFLTSCTTFLPTRQLDVCHFAKLSTWTFPSVSHLASCIAIREHTESGWHF
jgi:hypothetical protein